MLASLDTSAWAAEETVTAFYAWQVEGSVVQTAAERATVTGIFEGPVYIETDRGPVFAGTMSCPATVEIALDSGRQSARARCAFWAQDDSRIFAELTCQGAHLVGCDGDFEISGGAGRFAGITGGGEVVIRGDFHAVSVVESGSVRETVNGILYWPMLRYNLP